MYNVDQILSKIYVEPLVQRAPRQTSSTQEKEQQTI